MNHATKKNLINTDGTQHMTFKGVVLMESKWAEDTKIVGLPLNVNEWHEFIRTVAIDRLISATIE